MKGGLKLDSAAASRQGGDSGPAVVPGDVSKSLLVAALRHESFEMPPDGKLGADVIDDFTRWIEIGAPDPRDTAAAAAAREIDFAAARVAHWAFRPPQAVPPPDVHNAAWPLGDIDRFLLAALEARGLRPAEAAPPHIWLRRACLTLTGLPPTATETLPRSSSTSLFRFE